MIPGKSFTRREAIGSLAISAAFAVVRKTSRNPMVFETGIGTVFERDAQTLEVARSWTVPGLPNSEISGQNNDCVFVTFTNHYSVPTLKSINIASGKISDLALFGETGQVRVDENGFVCVTYYARGFAEIFDQNFHRIADFKISGPAVAQVSGRGFFIIRFEDGFVEVSPATRQKRFVRISGIGRLASCGMHLRATIGNELVILERGNKVKSIRLPQAPTELDVSRFGITFVTYGACNPGESLFAVLFDSDLRLTAQKPMNVRGRVASVSFIESHNLLLVGTNTCSPFFEGNPELILLDFSLKEVARKPSYSQFLSNFGVVPS